MNEQTIQEQYQHIISLLQQKRLKEAQSLLDKSGKTRRAA